MTASVLVIHDNPDRYFQNLVHRYPGCTFRAARSDDELKDQIDSFKPEILLSFRCDGITTAAQIKAARAECIQWIQVAGAGHDHLGDLSLLSCAVSNCGGVLSRFQAETVIGAMINLNFGFFHYQQQQEAKNTKKTPLEFTGRTKTASCWFWKYWQGSCQRRTPFWYACNGHSNTGPQNT